MRGLGTYCLVIAITTLPAVAYCQSRQGLQRPVAMVVDPANSTLYLASGEAPRITSFQLESGESRTLAIPVNHVVDLVHRKKSDALLVVVSNRESPLLRLDISNGRTEPIPLQLTHLPARIALTPNQDLLAISITWGFCVAVVPIGADGNVDVARASVVPLRFPPKEIVSIDDDHFLVADALAGQLATIDVRLGSFIVEHELNGHHIAGLHLSGNGANVLISHQRLSGIAETSRDDIHWGNLMQNLVSVLPIHVALDPFRSGTRSIRSQRLGRTGHGAADPMGVVGLRDGRWAIAASGTNKIVFGQQGSAHISTVDVGTRPTRLVAIDDQRLACLNSLDETISILSVEPPALLSTIGQAKVPQSPVELGERAFYSAQLSHDGWMSCNSCHIEGLSPDLLVDTLGDGSFGNAKRIPQLMHTAHTGPWGWDGSKLTLAQQLVSTLRTTMHRPDQHRQRYGSDEALSEQLIEFLTHRLPVESSSELALQTSSVLPGQRLFETGGCAKCHDPQSNFTTPAVYNLGLKDEQGIATFNPPSLLGLSKRRRYFHDGRFSSLEALLQNHPRDDMDWRVDEAQSLLAYLKSL